MPTAPGAILDEWDMTVDALRRDPWNLPHRWTGLPKKTLFDGYRRRDGIDFGDSPARPDRSAVLDVDPQRGCARLEQRGRLRRLTTDEQVTRAVTHAPENTRAYFRGECLRRYPEHVTAASWDSVIFDLPGRSALQRVPTLDPLRGTKTHVEDLLDASATAADLITSLQAMGA